MILDKTTLSSLGINLSDTEAKAFIEHFEETLQQRVGLEIFNLLDDEKAQELVALQESADEKTINEWVKAHVPDYEAVVQDEFDILMGEVADNAELVAA